MNIKQFFFGMALMGVASLPCGAQSLLPSQAEINVGQIMFRTPSSITVDFTNTASTPVSIVSVDTGCGCTVASYDKGSIMPGATTPITLTFDGKQLGYFYRYVKVTDSSGSGASELAVSGQVVTTISNFTGEYAFKVGSLMADVNNIEFDDVNKGQRAMQQVNIMNPTGQIVRPTALRLPSYLTVRTVPESLAPKQRGTMYLTLNSAELPDYGLTQTSIYLGKSTTEKVDASKEITVSAILLPKEMAKDDVSRPYAPRLTMSSDEIDMTELRKKSKCKADIVISNNGKSTLEISKLQMFTSGLEVKLDKTSIQPGEQTHLRVTGIAKQLKKERRQPRILMITNDPNNQKIVIKINR